MVTTSSFMATWPTLAGRVASGLGTAVVLISDSFRVRRWHEGSWLRPGEYQGAADGAIARWYRRPWQDRAEAPILRCDGPGASADKQIAGELGISEITVKAHRGKVMRKMAAGSLADLVKLAERRGAGLGRAEALSETVGTGR
jgi:hypothetical protein